MTEETKTKNISTNFLIIAAVIGLLVGAGGGYLLGIGSKEAAFKEGLTQGKEEMEAYYKEKIEEAFPSFEEEEITFIHGKVVETGSDSLVVRETKESNPIEGEEAKDWEVRVTDETEVVKMEEISPEELDRLIEEAEKTGGELPDPFTETEISLSEIEEGQWVSVEAGENIKGKESFEATKIMWEEMPI